jgi:hypothetical protein
MAESLYYAADAYNFVIDYAYADPYYKEALELCEKIYGKENT